MKQPVRILIADDHELIRKGFSVLLKKQTDLSIVGEAANGEELVELQKHHKAEIVITDIQMPGMGGIEATRQILAQFPETGIIALTMFNEDSLIIDMLEAGARGYILKNTTREELIEAIEIVHEGGSYFCNETSKKLTNLIASSRISFLKNNQPQLNSKEIEIVKLICKEYSSKQIAAQLGHTTRTVENYREKIQEKIGAKNMVGIAVYAMKNNIYKP
jgi:DNA-binding NarL/FixJ family response regulator